MAEESRKFDEAGGHRYFSSDCFNRAWELMEKERRTAAEDIEMLLAASASLWHWMQRQDRTEKNLSVGHWQVSRVYSLLSRGEEALRHGEKSLEYARAAGVRDFYLGYAHEAIARAAIILGKRDLVQEHVREGKKLAAGLENAEERATLEMDLQSAGGSEN